VAAVQARAAAHIQAAWRTTLAGRRAAAALAAEDARARAAAEAADAAAREVLRLQATALLGLGLGQQAQG
jgi:hypothetical protein